MTLCLRLKFLVSQCYCAFEVGPCNSPLEWPDSLACCHMTEPTPLPYNVHRCMYSPKPNSKSVGLLRYQCHPRRQSPQNQPTCLPPQCSEGYLPITSCSMTSTCCLTTWPWRHNRRKSAAKRGIDRPQFTWAACIVK